MFAIQFWTRSQRHKELTRVRVFARIRHGQQSGDVVFELQAGLFVIEGPSGIDGSAAGTVQSRVISPMQEGARHDTMHLGVLEMHRLVVPLADALFALTREDREEWSGSKVCKEMVLVQQL